MRTQQVLGRYRLLELVAEDAPGLALWHGYDEVLDRPIAIRVVPEEHPRAAAAVAAAQAAALVDDRRLLRVLDIITIPADDTSRRAHGIVSEWATGRTLEQTLLDRNGTPFAAPEALGLVADVARAVAAGRSHHVGHGRLRPSSVFITDAGEVRVRGLAVDAAVFGATPMSDGSQDATVARVDVDALGCLTYLLTTGYWPGALPVQSAPAPRAGDHLMPPSQVRAAVPAGVDDLVGRSVASAVRQRGRDPIVDPDGFAAAAGAALDLMAPLTMTTMKPVEVGPPSTQRRVLRIVGRLAAVAAGLVIVLGVAWTGRQLIISSPTTEPTQDPSLAEVLTSPATPMEQVDTGGLVSSFPIAGYRSYDPYGDDDGNGKPDKRKGRENEDLTVTVNDAEPDTAWLTSEYSTPDLDGKGGVGLIIDLGETREVQQVSVNLIGRGTGLEVRVADGVLRDPALWTPLGAAFAPGDKVTVRAPRPVSGQYVLLWFTQLPPGEGSGNYQGGVRSVSVSGE